MKPGKSTLLLLVAVGLALLGRYLYFRPDVSANELAPNFRATTADGTTLGLSDLRGSYVLLEFWGSWCGPCRAKLPELHALRRDFPELALVSVAIEQDTARWRAALTRDGRVWPQTVELTPSLRFFSGPISDLYGVNRVPQTFLIGPGGRVVRASPDSEQIRKILSDAR